MENPLWDEIVEKLGRAPTRLVPQDTKITGPDETPWYRHLIRKYAWTISDPASVAFVMQQAGRRIVEIGAGSGYWAWLLRQNGIGVEAFDTNQPDNPEGGWYRRPAFYPIQTGGPEQAARFPGHTLLLAWPPPGPLAAQTLRCYTGQRLIFMGPFKQVTEAGDAQFFAALAKDWTEVARHQPVRWYSAKDDIVVFDRLPVSTKKA